MNVSEFAGFLIGAIIAIVLFVAIKRLVSKKSNNKSYPDGGGNGPHRPGNNHK